MAVVLLDMDGCDASMGKRLAAVSGRAVDCAALFFGRIGCGLLRSGSSGCAPAETRAIEKGHWRSLTGRLLYNSTMQQSQVVIVTGASSGIGRAAALRFGRAGTAVIAVGRNSGALADVAALVNAQGSDVDVVEADVTADGAARRIVAATLGRFGRLTTVVNAAGIIGSGTIETTTDAQWREMMAVNVDAPFRLMRAAAAALAETRGSIVNVSSVTGLRAFPGVLAYCVSKAAVDQLTRCAALEMAPAGVRVNAVNPGVVISNLHRRGGMEEDRYAAFLEHSKTTHPLGRPGEPAEIAELIHFLASDDAAWITGETISVDGGRHLTCAR
jgi:NAD(P)-dependent dehydrogenase (short-subunit alcohol dehydrogenase family)